MLCLAGFRPPVLIYRPAQGVKRLETLEEDAKINFDRRPLS